MKYRPWRPYRRILKGPKMRPQISSVGGSNLLTPVYCPIVVKMTIISVLSNPIR